MEPIKYAIIYGLGIVALAVWLTIDEYVFHRRLHKRGGESVQWQRRDGMLMMANKCPVCGKLFRIRPHPGFYAHRMFNQKPKK